MDNLKGGVGGDCLNSAISLAVETGRLYHLAYGYSHDGIYMRRKQMTRRGKRNDRERSQTVVAKASEYSV